MRNEGSMEARLVLTSGSAREVRSAGRIWKHMCDLLCLDAESQIESILRAVFDPCEGLYCFTGRCSVFWCELSDSSGASEA